MRDISWDLIIECIRKSKRLHREMAPMLDAPSDGALPGRIVAQEGPVFTVITPKGSVQAQTSGRVSYSSRHSDALTPAVGDYVVVGRDVGPQIERVFTRVTAFERKEAGDRVRAQVLCANVDLAVIVTTAPPSVALDRDEEAERSLRDFSVRRVERFIATLDPLVHPIVILNKCDLVDDAERVRLSVEAKLPGARVIAVSALDGTGVNQLAAELQPGLTAVLVGSSGSGKSTLIGRLVGHDIATGAVRAFDGRGKHTTTTRAMYALDNGALIVDTPGVREVQLWAGENEADGRLERAFPEIAEHAGNCRFRDCTHVVEPECAVRAAVRDGAITHDRFLSYLQLRDERATTSDLREKQERLTQRRVSRRARYTRGSRGG